MRICIVTSYPTESFTAQTFMQAAVKHDASANMMRMDDLMLVQHPEGDHVVFQGTEIQRYDVILSLVDVHCPSYEAILDALRGYCELMINDGQVHRDTFDELSFYKQLQKVGVQFPATVSIFSPVHAEQVAKSFESLKGSPFPVLVRLLLNKHRNGLIKVDSLGSLRTLIEALCEEEIPFVVQEHAYHRGTFSGYVFGGETLSATVIEVGNADDEFRSGLEGMQATYAKLDELDESTLARVSNAVGRALVEVCFIKNEHGQPKILDVKPYVRFDALNHSTGLQVANEVAEKLFARLDALLPKPDAPEPEPAPEDDVLPPPKPTTISITIHPLNDDQPLEALIAQGDQEKATNTIWVSDLQCDWMANNWIAFKFRGYNYKIPKPPNASEVSTDNSVTCGPVWLNTKCDGQSFSTDFYLRDIKDGDMSGQVWVRQDAFSTKTPDAPTPPESSPDPRPEVSG